MAPTSLDRLLVFAPDLDRAKQFYQQVLGLALDRESETHAELSSATIRLAIFKCETAGSPDDYSERAGSALAFGVADLEAEVGRLRELGVSLLHDEPASGPVGRYIAFVDPFGTVHELVESVVSAGGAA